MKTKIYLAVVLAAMFGTVLLGKFFGQKNVVEKSAPRMVARAASPTQAPTSTATIVAVPEKTSGAVAPSEKIISSAKAQKQKSAKPAKPKDPVQDPDARVALSLVGADPAAEAYWMSAINNPNLPPDERRELIEDLNQDGLTDPKHPAPEDMPLILNRLALLEQINPMDQVNADAIQEAYKDLANLASGGTPQ